MVCLLICCLMWLTSEAGESRVRALSEARARLRHLHARLGEPEPGDWLAVHPEPGQTFEQYLDSRPVTPTKERNVVYVQPLGEFTAGQREVVKLTAEFMALYLNLPVKVRDDLPMALIPARARRVHPAWGVSQILTTYVLEEVLTPRRPDDAAAYIAFTGSDLWPGPGWNFVFGQASLRERVGVWSLYRNGDPDASEEGFRLCLLRTMKTGVHETCHMFSMLHCTAYACCMNGSNHRAEADRRPLALCPECAAKLCWATGAEPVERFRKLADFARKQKLETEASFWESSIAALGE